MGGTPEVEVNHFVCHECRGRYTGTVEILQLSIGIIGPRDCELCGATGEQSAMGDGGFAVYNDGAFELIRAAQRQKPREAPAPPTFDSIEPELKPVADAAARAARFHGGHFFVAFVGASRKVYCATNFDREQELALAELLSRDPDKPASPPNLTVIDGGSDADG